MLQHFYGVHDLCNDIHMLEASVLAACGHVAKPPVQWSTNHVAAAAR